MAPALSHRIHEKGVDAYTSISRGGLDVSPSLPSCCSLPHRKRKYGCDVTSGTAVVSENFSCAAQMSERQTLLRTRVETICSPTKLVLVSAEQSYSWAAVCRVQINTMHITSFRVHKNILRMQLGHCSLSLLLAGCCCSTGTTGALKAARRRSLQTTKWG